MLFKNRDWTKARGIARIKRGFLEQRSYSRGLELSLKSTGREICNPGNEFRELTQLDRVSVKKSERNRLLMIWTARILYEHTNMIYSDSSNMIKNLA